MHQSAAARPARIRRRCLLIAVLALCLGCTGPATERMRLRSGDPIERATAAKRLGAWRDPRAVPGLIELLEDDDHGVRMIAIGSLRRICGQDFDYRYYSDERERELAVERWRSALRSGMLRMTPESPRVSSQPTQR